MSERVEAFFAAYRTAFEAFDAGAITALFSYPCHIAGDTGAIAVATVATPAEWLPQIERLVSAYRAMGVSSAEILERRVTELTPRLAQATIRWRLLGREQRRIYDFDASYTLVDHGQGMRIAALAHNENARLRASVEEERAG